MSPYLQEDAEISPVTEAITLAVQQSGGRALGGRATFIPLLERCGTETTLQFARFPHPQLPSLRAQLSVPQLRFYISPARVRRVLRVLRAAVPGITILLTNIDISPRFSSNLKTESSTPSP